MLPAESTFRMIQDRGNVQLRLSTIPLLISRTEGNHENINKGSQYSNQELRE